MKHIENEIQKSTAAAITPPPPNGVSHILGASKADIHVIVGTDVIYWLLLITTHRYT